MTDFFPPSMMEATLIDKMGTDLTVVNAARVSFNKESEELTPRDSKLINYLANHNHWTTFGHCMAQFRVKAPIFVARQLVKHQVGLVWNEVSRRYIDSRPEYWMPEHLNSRPDGSIKQGAGGVHPQSDFWKEKIKEQVINSVMLYDLMIADNVAPEEARIVLALNTMTEWWWTGSLYAWARICNLRLDPHAQGATQEIAQLFSNQMATAFPESWKALVKLDAINAL